MWPFRKKQTFTQNVPEGNTITQKKVQMYPDEWISVLIVEQNGILSRIEAHLGMIARAQAMQGGLIPPPSTPNPMPDEQQ